MAVANRAAGSCTVTGAGEALVPPYRDELNGLYGRSATHTVATIAPVALRKTNESTGAPRGEADGVKVIDTLVGEAPRARSS